jgi:glycosyltransferase involved in cell wall biosynthesis
MPEVADKAALLFDPNSRGELLRAMRDLLLDTELRQRMERMGLKNASRFSWEKAARQTLEVYYEVAGRRRKKSKVNVRVAQAVQSS